MARLKRTESQALTREKLLAAARELFRKVGYSATSIDRIAETAGFSKGAIYSNFENKQDVLLAVLELDQPVFEQLLSDVERSAEDNEIADLLVAWAFDCSQNRNWVLAILEHVRSSHADAASIRRQEEILRTNWRRLGASILARHPDILAEPETLGALLHEIAYAPAMTFVSKCRSKKKLNNMNRL